MSITSTPPAPYHPGFLELSVLMQKFQEMPNVGPVDFDDLLLFKNHTDLDGDGVIGFDDFVAIGTQKLVPAPVEEEKEEEVMKEPEPAAERAGAEGVAAAGEAAGGEDAAPEDGEAAEEARGAHGDGEARAEADGGAGAAASQPEMA